MPAAPKLPALAAALLEAHVQYVIDELTGPEFEDLLTRDVSDVLAVAGTLTVRSVIDPSAVKASARTLVDVIGGSAIVANLVGALADAGYDLSASEEYELGAVVDREAVSALLGKLLAMRTLQDRAMERMSQSPLVATMATKFVGQIVADFVAQNRQNAERIPGVSSLFSIGQSAASKAKSVSDRTLGGLIGDATDRGAQMALKRTNHALRELIRDPQFAGAVLEVWDLHADEPISELRAYLSKKELRELALLVHELLISARNDEFVGLALDAAIDVFFAEYGDHDLAALLAEVGLDAQTLVAEAVRFAPGVIAAAHESGELARLIRGRLEPFYASPAVAALLKG